MKRPLLQRRALRKLLPKLNMAQEDFGHKLEFLADILATKSESQLKQIVKNSLETPTKAPIRY